MIPPTQPTIIPPENRNGLYTAGRIPTAVLPHTPIRLEIAATQCREVAEHVGSALKYLGEVPNLSLEAQRMECPHPDDLEVVLSFVHHRIIRALL